MNLNLEHMNFMMKITDVFNISGRGKIALGKIDFGEITPETRVKVINFIEKVNLKVDEFEINVIEIEMFQKRKIPFASMGDNVALVLNGLEKFKIRKGHYLVCGEGEDYLNKILASKTS